MATALTDRCIRQQGIMLCPSSRIGDPRLQAKGIVVCGIDLGDGRHRTIHGRFSPDCMGSIAFSDRAIPDAWAKKVATDGAAFAEELALTIASLPAAAMLPLGFPVHAYLEVHIDRGPSLEAAGVPIGVVRGIQGIR